MLVLGILMIICGALGYYYVYTETGNIYIQAQGWASRYAGYTTEEYQRLEYIKLASIILLIVGVLFFIIGLVQQMIKANEHVNKNNDETTKKSNTEKTEYMPVEYNFDSTQKTALCEVFHQDIYNEISYVFGKERFKMFKCFPENLDQETWICACNMTNNADVCLTCGVTKQELASKLNYNYLKKSREDRLNAKKELETQKRKTIKKRVLAFAKACSQKMFAILRVCKKFLLKNKMKLGVIIGILFVSISGYKIVVNSEGYKFSQCIKRAEEACENNDLYQAYFCYTDALNIKKDESAYLGIYNMILENPTFHYCSGAQLLNMWGNTFPESERLAEITAELTPDKVAIQLPEGTYTEKQRIILPEREDSIYYNLYYQNEPIVNNEAFGEDISLENPGDFVLEVWGYNHAWDLSGEAVQYSYTLDLKRPENLQASLESGNYRTCSTVALTSPDGYDIYYTMDGTIPTKSSLFYNNEIQLQYGFNCIKAVAFSEQGVSGEVLMLRYGIANEIERGYGSITDHNGYYFNYFCTTNGISIESKSGESVNLADYKSMFSLHSEEGTNIEIIQANEKGNYGSGNVKIIREYGEKIYYIVQNDNESNSIKRLDLITGEEIALLENAVLRDSMLVVANEQIYYITDGDYFLYRMDLNGDKVSVICQEQIFDLSKFNNIVYCLGRGFEIGFLSPDNSITKTGVVNIRDYVIRDGIIYYIGSEDRSRLLINSNVEITTLFGAPARPEEYKAPVKGFFNGKNGYRNTYSSYVTIKTLCGSSIYYEVSESKKCYKIDYLTNDETVDTTTHTNTLYKYDTNTLKTTRMASIFDGENKFFDNMIIVKGTERYNVVH